MTEESPAVVGHGPVPFHSPYVPDFVIVRDGEKEVVVTRDGPHTGPPDAFRRECTVRPCEPSPLRPGMWPLVSAPDGGPSTVLDWMPLKDEAAWRAQRAKEMLESTKTMAGRPDEVIQVIIAASKLVGYDVEAAARKRA